MNRLRQFRVVITKLRSSQRLDEAIALCDDSMHVEELRYAAFCERTDLKYDRGQYEDAFSDLERMIELRPVDPSPFYVRARWHLMLGNEEAAAADATVVINAGEMYFMSAAHFMRALANCLLGKLDLAQEDCAKLPADYKTAIDTQKLGWRMMSRADLQALIQ